MKCHSWKHAHHAVRSTLCITACCIYATATVSPAKRSCASKTLRRLYTGRTLSSSRSLFQHTLCAHYLQRLSVFVGLRSTAPREMQGPDQDQIMEPVEDTPIPTLDASMSTETENAANERDISPKKEDEIDEEAAAPAPSTKETVKNTTESAAEAEDPEDEDAPLDLMKMREFEFSQVSNLTPAQLRRYEQYRRSDLKSSKVRKVLTTLNPMMQKASDQYVIAIKGLGKLFVGDVVETALEVRKERGETGALTPRQIREAYRRLRRAGAVPTTSNWSEGSLW